MEFAAERIAHLDGKRISIGLINSNAVLKEWYARQGYIEQLVRKLAYLPFDVCIMVKDF